MKFGPLSKHLNSLWDIAGDGDPPCIQRQILEKVFEKSNLKANEQYGNFIDEMHVRVVGGNGGNGCGSFENTTWGRGRPDGGNGGRGGSVHFYADATQQSIILPKLIRAENGATGDSNNCTGRGGKDVKIGVPLGSFITEIQVDRQFTDNWENDEIHEDSSNLMRMERCSHPELPEKVHLAVPYESILVANGGRGGRGNLLYGSNNLERERGQPGQDRLLLVSLEIIAELGLVGLPNAGKSTFLNSITNANTRVGSFPFTTLRPFLGVLNDSRCIVRIADIPGLIPDAHKNRGLGHQFLKHILQSRILAFVLDVSRPDPLLDLRILQSELELYHKGLSDKAKFVICNKIDRNFDKVDLIRQNVPWAVYPVSARFGIGLEHVVSAILKELNIFR